MDLFIVFAIIFKFSHCISYILWPCVWNKLRLIEWLIGRLARSSVHLSVLFCMGSSFENEKVWTWKNRNRYERSPDQDQPVCQFSAQMVKGQVDGRTICRHWVGRISPVYSLFIAEKRLCVMLLWERLFVRRKTETDNQTEGAYIQIKIPQPERRSHNIEN